MGQEIIWADSPVGKAVEAHIAEIKDVPYVVAFLSDLQVQEYNESVLDECRFPYAFLSLYNPEIPDSEESYLYIYFVKLTEEMHALYFNPMFFVPFKSPYFRVYYNGEFIAAYTKTSAVSPPGN